VDIERQGLESHRKPETLSGQAKQNPLDRNLWRRQTPNQELTRAPEGKSTKNTIQQKRTGSRSHWACRNESQAARPGATREYSRRNGDGSLAARAEKRRPPHTRQRENQLWARSGANEVRRQADSAANQKLEENTELSCAGNPVALKQNPTKARESADHKRTKLGCRQSKLSSICC
jgi:hypothetical protein